MKTIKGTSRLGARLSTAYAVSEDTTLKECYKTFSFSKQLAYDHCRQLMEIEHGHDFRILSHNTMVFTCGWYVDGVGLRVETAYNSYLIVF